MNNVRTESLPINIIYDYKYSVGVKKVQKLKNPIRRAYYAIANIQDELRLLRENKESSKKTIKRLKNIKDYMYLIADVREGENFKNLEKADRDSVNTFYSEICGIAISISYLVAGIKVKGYAVDWANLTNFFSSRDIKPNNRLLLS